MASNKNVKLYTGLGDNILQADTVKVEDATVANVEAGDTLALDGTQTYGPSQQPYGLVIAMNEQIDGFYASVATEGYAIAKYVLAAAIAPGNPVKAEAAGADGVELASTGDLAIGVVLDEVEASIASVASPCYVRVKLNKFVVPA